MFKMDIHTWMIIQTFEGGGQYSVYNRGFLVREEGGKKLKLK